jgi:formylglycine-generating enzyme required for sulfatase activity
VLIFSNRSAPIQAPGVTVNAQSAVTFIRLIIGSFVVIACFTARESKTEEPGNIVSSASNWILGMEPGQVRADNGLKMKFVWCPPGRFSMGNSTSKQIGSLNKHPVVVTLTKGFWLGKYEVTQGEWERVMNTTPWKGKKEIKEGAEYPATFVNLRDAEAFAAALTLHERSAGRLPEDCQYILPSEAQWEYACRAGAQEPALYSFGNDESQLSDYAWWGALCDNGNTTTERHSHPVGLKKPNAWGLHDLHGNVWEWCRDGYDDRLLGGNDPERTQNLACRVIRGGCWGSGASMCRTATRDGSGAETQGANKGFRLSLIRTLPETNPLKIRADASLTTDK